MTSPDTWPDGEPVTPWADPWHDILGDIRDSDTALRGLTEYQRAEDDND